MIDKALVKGFIQSSVSLSYTFPIRSILSDQKNNDWNKWNKLIVDYTDYYNKLIKVRLKLFVIKYPDIL